ncbi:MAG: roadblock/LC7 domain-containing protein [Candidatus Nanopelagicales bacterium]
MADIEVPHPGASDIVGRLLSDALSEHPDVQWLGLVSEDGFAIASEGAPAVNDDAVAAGAVRMMTHVRQMSKALGQANTSQIFLEGDDSGICVIDKDPWVLVVVGAPGVPIGLLRYEAREIAEAFPMGQRPALPATGSEEGDQEPDSDWAVVTTGSFVPHEQSSGESTEDVVTAAEAAEVTQLDGEPEIRWADEPTVADPGFPGLVLEDDVMAQASDIFGGTQPESVEELEMPSVDPDDFSDWSMDTAPAPRSDDLFDLAPPAPDAPVSFEMPAPSGFDIAESGESALPGEFETLPPPAGFAVDDLSDLAPPAGPVIDLPPPTGQAFELPPPE